MSDVTEVKAAVAADATAVKADVSKVKAFIAKVEAIVVAGWKQFAIGVVVGFAVRFVIAHL
jgi:hypothetical protein